MHSYQRFDQLCRVVVVGLDPGYSGRAVSGAWVFSGEQDDFVLLGSDEEFEEFLRDIQGTW
jgi:hypothetical protein